MSKIRTVGDLLEDFFDKHPEYQGLYNPDGDCACASDDFIHCGSDFFNCCFGVQVPCDCGDHDFHIVDPDSVKKENVDA